MNTEDIVLYGSSSQDTECPKPESIEDMLDSFIKKKRATNKMVAQKPEEPKCSRCKRWGTIVEDTINGSVVCGVCGLVLAVSKIDPGPEWRYYGDSDSRRSDPTRCQIINPLLPQSSLSTNISCPYGVKQASWVRYAQWTAMPYKERSLFKVFKRIDKVDNIPSSIRNKAKYYIKIILEEILSRGGKKDGLIGASVYFACKQENITIRGDVIAKKMDIAPKEMSKGCTRFLKIIYNLGTDIESMCKNSTTYLGFIPKFCDQLGLPFKFSIIVGKIAKCVDILGCLQNNNSVSIAAGCLYLAVLEYEVASITKEDIHRVCGVSTVTISNTHKILVQHKDFIFGS